MSQSTADTLSGATDKRTKNWSDEELDILVNAWAEESVQEQLDGTTRNARVFNDLAGILKGAGFVRTPAQCRDKLKNLKKTYKAVKDSNNRSGRGRSKCRHYDISIVGGQRSRNAHSPGSHFGCVNAAAPYPGRHKRVGRNCWVNF